MHRRAVLLAVVVVLLTPSLPIVAAQSGCRPMCPAVPENLRAQAADSAVELDWDPPLDPGTTAITEYRVYRGTISGAESYLDSTSDTMFVDTAPPTGVRVYYRVSAVNDAGEGPRTEPVSVRVNCENSNLEKFMKVGCSVDQFDAGCMLVACGSVFVVADGCFTIANAFAAGASLSESTAWRFRYYAHSDLGTTSFERTTTGSTATFSGSYPVLGVGNFDYYVSLWADDVLLAQTYNTIKC